MRIVGKFKEKDIWLVTLYMSETYGSPPFNFNLSKESIEEINRNILKDSQDKESKRFFGDETSSLLILSEGCNLNESLPDAKVFARVRCALPVRGASPVDYISELILIWFQKGSDDPLDKLGELVKDIDWEAKAEHLYIWNSAGVV